MARNALKKTAIKRVVDEVDDDFLQGYDSGLKEFHNKVDTNTGEDLEALCSCSRYPGHRFYIMYHGTTWNNAQKIQTEGFVRSSGGMLGPGVYLSRDFDKASRYPQSSGSQKRAVLKVNVRVGKVKKIDYQGHPLQYTWHQHGYDTAWVPPNCGMVASGLEEDCVYEPWRIKVLKIIPI